MSEFMLFKLQMDGFLTLCSFYICYRESFSKEEFLVNASWVIPE